MDIIYTKDREWLDKWDAYVASEDKASHLMLSEWNRSFGSYGFDFEICIALQDGKICGGFAAVIAKAMVFRFYIVPYGPIVSNGFEKHFEELIANVNIRAKFHYCCYSHITLPVSEVENAHVYHAFPKLKILENAKTEHRFKYVYSSNGLNWVGFKDATDEEALLNSFRASVRRYIRSSLRKELHEKFLVTENEIRQGYELCLENARNHNYSLRDWNSFKDTLIHLIQEKKAYFIGAFKENEIKGAALIVNAGNYNTYILGGTKKEKPDVLAGHFLHWKAIELTFRQNLSGYNISLGGSKGVTDLKNSYADGQIYFSHSKYHWILKPFYFKMYLFLEKNMKPYKKTISRILAFIKKR